MKKFLRRLFPTKEMREYRKMYRRHRKAMIKLAKEDQDWDWCFLHDLVITKIKHMYEYYLAGNNVWQNDESSNEVCEQLKHILDLQNELDTLWDDYDNYDVEREIIKDGVIKVNVSDEALAIHRAKYDREQALYEEIYSYIGKYIQWWWD